MASSSMFRLVFVLYCAEAGIFLLVTPWISAWNRLADLLPWTDLRWLLLSPLTRAAVCAFGLLHLVWIVHDVDLFLRRREPAPFAGSPSETAGGR
ncbi:MAG: hypothetical protein AB7G12_12910 [Thermoanaerobaculia bacterium]